MKKILKSLLALSLVFSLGLSAAENKTGKPVEVQSKTQQAAVLAASVVTNGVVAGALICANLACLRGVLYTDNHSFLSVMALAGMVSNVAAAQLGSDLIKKMGLKSDPVWLHAVSTSWFSILMALKTVDPAKSLYK